MTIDIVFVRHGEHRDNELTERGRQTALEAGQWLADRGVVASRYLHTTEQRTKQTAEQLAASLPAASLPVELVSRKGIARSSETFIQRCREYAPDDGVLIIVGHHTTQRVVEKHFGGKRFGVPRDNRGAAFAMRWDGDTLVCTDVFAGCTKR